VLGGLGRGNPAAAPADDDGQFGFVVQLGGFARADDRSAGPDSAEAGFWKITGSVGISGMARPGSERWEK
jgi:hypothetical protein